VDEDAFRIGKLHQGIPVLHPAAISSNAVYLPIPENRAIALKKRLQDLMKGVRIYAAPDLPFS